MRLALLAPAGSIHTIRWANGLAERGFDVNLMSLHPASAQLSPDVCVHRLPVAPPHGYFLAASPLRRLLQRLKPDLLHVHYASGYGTLGRLSKFHPQVLSVWGSDVFHFPTVSPVHRWMIRRNLATADHVSSTSHAMATQVAQLTGLRSKISVVPFGVDTHKFMQTQSTSYRGEFVIGTVKSLAPVYGIDTLLESFAHCRRQLQIERHPLHDKLRLRIVGEGPQRAELEQLANRLDLSRVTTFVGAVTYDQVPAELNQFDIYVASSRRESFGVAVIEASACERPVVVSDTGGLPEVVAHGKTGFIVPRENPTKLAEAMIDLIRRPDLRIEFGRNGRQLVKEKYEWQSSVDQMIELYLRLIAPQRRRHAA
jgi:glycosyltransferase involved in cell wall biosynthesis